MFRIKLRVSIRYILNKNPAMIQMRLKIRKKVVTSDRERPSTKPNSPVTVKAVWISQKSMMKIRTLKTGE
jgi:hypothetical protein